MLKTIALGLFAGVLIIAAPISSEAAHHEEAEATPAATEEAVETTVAETVSCIDTRHIKSTKAIDNQTVIFSMRVGPDYKMTTINRCSGLKMQNTIVYDPTPSNRLCAVDVIKVPTMSSSGLHNMSFTHCPIDKFEVIAEGDE